MADVLFVAVTIGFFSLASALVTWCDRVVGVDQSTPHGSTEITVDPTADAAGARAHEGDFELLASLGASSDHAAGGAS